MKITNQDGFAKNSVLIIIAALCIILGSYFFLSASFNKSIVSYSKYYNKINDIENLLKSIENDMQCFKDYEEDFPGCIQLVDLEQKYTNYNLILSDVSSGINKEFLSEAQLEKIETEDYMEVNYGWCNKNAYEEEIQKRILNTFINGKQCIFINELPLANINFLDDVTKKAFEECGLKEYLGKKTTFWKADLIYEEKVVEAVYCALVSEDLKKIEKYCLINKDIKEN